MINTIFYFPESLTFDQYTNLLDSDTDEGIARRTIVFARQQGKIYNNGKLYGTTSSDVQSLINAAKSELEAQDAALNQSIEEAISQFSNNINSLQNEIESDIQNAINTAKSYDDLIKTDLNITNNKIATVSTKVNQIEDRIDGFSEGGNIKYTQALQSVINSGINNNAAFNNISSRWAVADENQNLLQWMASGFQSQSGQGSSFAQIYSTDKSTINDNIQSAAAAVKTAVRTDEDGIVSSAMGQILSSLTNNEINNVSGLITKVDEKASQSDVISAISIANSADSKADSANSATSSLSAALTTLDGSVVKKASVITSINASGESNVKINADKIQVGDINISAGQVSGITDLITDTVTADYVQTRQSGLNDLLTNSSVRIDDQSVKISDSNRQNFQGSVSDALELTNNDITSKHVVVSGDGVNTTNTIRWKLDEDGNIRVSGNLIVGGKLYYDTSDITKDPDGVYVDAAFDGTEVQEVSLSAVADAISDLQDEISNIKTRLQALES